MKEEILSLFVCKDLERQVGVYKDQVEEWDVKEEEEEREVWVEYLMCV